MNINMIIATLAEKIRQYIKIFITSVVNCSIDYVAKF